MTRRFTSQVVFHEGVWFIVSHKAASHLLNHPTSLPGAPGVTLLQQFPVCHSKSGQVPIPVTFHWFSLGGRTLKFMNHFFQRSLDNVQFQEARDKCQRTTQAAQEFRGKNRTRWSSDLRLKMQSMCKPTAVSQAQSSADLVSCQYSAEANI